MTLNLLGKETQLTSLHANEEISLLSGIGNANFSMTQLAAE